MELSPDGTLLAVASFHPRATGYVSFVDVASFAQVGQVEIQGNDPQTIEPCFSSDGAYVFASNEVGETVSVVAVNGGTSPEVVATIPVDPTPTAVVIDGTNLYVTSEGTGQAPGTGSLQVFDVSDPTYASRIARVEITPAPVRVALSAEGGEQYAWVSARGPNHYFSGNEVRAYDVARLLSGQDAYVGTTPVGKAPVGLLVFGANDFT